MIGLVFIVFPVMVFVVVFVMREGALRHFVIIEIAITAGVAEIESAQIIAKGQRGRLAIINGLSLPGNPQSPRLNILSCNGLINHIDNAANGAIGKQKGCGPPNDLNLLGIGKVHFVNMIAAEDRDIPGD